MSEPERIRIGPDNKTWNLHFIEMAMLVAKKSRDPRTKCGAVIVSADNSVLSTGYNGFPRGVAYTDGRLYSDDKYDFIEHAERNAILNAARHGTKLLGSKMYLNFRPECCTDCTKAIIQSGITEVYGPDIPFPGSERWRKNRHNFDMMKEAGIDLHTVEWEQ